MTREVSTRFDVLRNGTKLTELTPVDAPRVEMVSTAKIKSSLSGTFVQNPDYDPVGDRIQPFLIINGEEYPLGEFEATAHATGRTIYGGSTVEITALDQGVILDKALTEDRVFIRAGTAYTDYVQSILVANKIEKILCIDSPLTVQTDREDWEIGTPWLDVINDLLGEINYNSLWFDRNGFARMNPYQAPTAGNITVTYREGTLIKPEYSTELDMLGKPNVFIAVVNNPDYDRPMTASAENDNPTSPLSTVRQGRIPEIIRLDNISSQAELQKYVDGRVSKSMISTETVKFTTATNGSHSVWDVIALDIPGLNGVFQEVSWSLTLSHEGEMTHEAKRVTYL